MICELPSFVLFAGSGRFSVSSNQHILMKYKHICLVKGLICGYATGPFDSHSNWIWTYLWCFSSQFLFKLNDCVFSDQKAGGIFTFPALLYVLYLFVLYMALFVLFVLFSSDDVHFTPLRPEIIDPDGLEMVDHLGLETNQLHSKNQLILFDTLWFLEGTQT